MSRIYRVEALIAKVNKIGESDCLIALFTKELGKIIAVSRGSRKITSRKAPYLDLFNHLTVYLSKGRNFDVITDIKPQNSFVVLREDLLRVAGTFKIMEVVVRIMPEREGHIEVFNKLLDILKLMNGNNELDVTGIVQGFANFLLNTLGYKESGKELKDRELDNFLEEIMEKK